MILASFDAGRNREAAIVGAYQYDTGQRIRMHGLPAPEELAQMDELLGGEGVTVQAQYAYRGDSQSEPRLARYDEKNDCWEAEVPDSYLTRCESVFVYVYVMYGADEERSRSKTMYTGSFTPISRAAPGTEVTPDQRNAWDSLVAEVNLVLAKMNEAISGANAAAAGAKEAAQEAGEAAQTALAAAADAQAMTQSWRGATAQAQTLDPGSDATVALEDGEDGMKRFLFGIPRGEKGEKGDKGPAGVTFTLRGAELYIDTY